MRNLTFWLLRGFAWCCFPLAVHVLPVAFKKVRDTRLSVWLFFISNHLHVSLFIRSFSELMSKLQLVNLCIFHSPRQCINSFDLPYSALFDYRFYSVASAFILFICLKSKVRFLCSLLLDFWFHFSRKSCSVIYQIFGLHHVPFSCLSFSPSTLRVFHWINFAGSEVDWYIALWLWSLSYHNFPRLLGL